MPDLQHDLAALEAEYARVETQLATQQADQQEQLQALADQFTAENTTLAREMVMLSGALRHVRGQIARDEQAQQAENLHVAQAQGDLALEALKNDVACAEARGSIQRDNLSLLQRITHQQEAERFAAANQEQDAEQDANVSLRDHFRTLQRDMISAAFPDNDPD